MIELCHIIRLPVKRLITTNETMDNREIDSLVDALENGLIRPNDLEPLYVYFDGLRYFVNDGNHRTAALRIAGVEKILCEIYTDYQLQLVSR